MELSVNMLLEWDRTESEGQTRTIERILFIDPCKSHLITIDIFLRNALPKIYSYNRIVDSIESTDARILSVDPYQRLMQPENDISQKHRDRRDQAWQIIEKVLEKAGSEVYSAKIRGNVIAQVERETKKPRKTIYHYLRKYWQCGCTKNALLPKYYKCAHKGQRLGKSNSDTKLGRADSLSLKTGKPRGIRLTSKDIKFFEKGIKKFYLTPEQNSLRTAYQKTLSEFYNDGYDFKELISDFGNKLQVAVPHMPTDETLPTFKQFRYWYETYYRDKNKEYKARYGERNFNLLKRELYGDSTKMAFGPGAIYMIDATIADVYLVSSYDARNIIGKPIIYLVVDVFSRMIVGFAVTLEGPSWLGAMLAMDNVVANKVDFCQQYGFLIQEWQWPCCSLPEAIFADRGEFEGYNADTLVNSLGVKIHNTPPYRGDLKGIVERQFGIAKEKVIRFIPGSTVRKRDRGEKHNALDAQLDLRALRKLIIHYILDYNCNHRLSWYRREPLQINDNVPLKPLSLWNWGIRNRSGCLHSFPREIVRLNLLPRKEIAVNKRHGLHFGKDLYYNIPPIIRNPSKGMRVTVAYDPQNMNEVYLPSPDNMEAIACSLTHNAQTFKNRSLEEIQDVFAKDLLTSVLERSCDFQTKASFDAVQNFIINSAVEKTEKARLLRARQSDKYNLRNIRSNRKAENEIERAVNAFNHEISEAPSKPTHLLPEGISPEENIDASIVKSKNSYVPPVDNKSLLKKLREEQKQLKSQK